MGLGAESNAAPPQSHSPVEATNLQQLLAACLQIQERLQTTQLAIEQNRQETKDLAAQNTMALSNGLQFLQEGFAAQRARDREAMQRSNHVMLGVAGAFVALGVLAVLIVVFLQWRTSRVLAEISAALPTVIGLGSGPAVTALNTAEQSNLRLLGAMDLLDQRLHEFKRAVSQGGNGSSGPEPDRAAAELTPETPPANDRARVSLLLSQGQSMMSLDNVNAALACFDEALSLDPNHAEALVKKGAALERLHKLNEALECYDRAIAADDSMTLAYLHKGGLYNRLERFKEALACYGKALRTHDQHTS